jgi:hypothetical protein
MAWLDLAAREHFENLGRRENIWEGDPETACNRYKRNALNIFLFGQNIACMSYLVLCVPSDL